MEAANWTCVEFYKEHFVKKIIITGHRFVRYLFVEKEPLRERIWLLMPITSAVSPSVGDRRQSRVVMSVAVQSGGETGYGEDV